MTKIRRVAAKNKPEAVRMAKSASNKKGEKYIEGSVERQFKLESAYGYTGTRWVFDYKVK